jgi:alpha-1,3-rhamnosyl/mannosyltransferase
MNKIAFGITNLNKGLSKGGIDGIGVYSQQLFKHITELESDIELIPYQFGNFPSKQQVIGFPSYPNYLLKNSLGITAFQNDKVFSDVELIHATDLLIPISQKKIVATVMDTIPLSNPEFIKSKFGKYKAALWKKLIHKNVDHIITCSQFSKKEICKYLEFPENKVSVTPLGVDKAYFERKSEEEIQKIKNKYKIPEKYFLYICTIQPRKNIIRLLEAHQSLPDKVGKEIPIILVGKFSWDDGNIMKTIQSAQEDKRCIWINYISENEKICLLQGSIGVPFVSLYEGFGLPIIEAFASRAPILGSNCSSIPEVLGDLLPLIEPFSVDSMRVGLELLIDKRVSDTELQLNFERASLFSWENTAIETIKIYQSLKS